MSEKTLGHQITSGVIWTFGERFLAQIVSFIVSLVLARILLPNDYGIVAMVNVFISFADVLVSNGFSSALVQDKRAGDKEFSTIFFCNLILSIILYAILFFLAPFIAKIYKMELLSTVIRVFSLKLIPASFQSIQSAYVSRNMMFKKFFFSTLGGTLVSAVVGILLALNGFGVWALVIQYMTNSIIDTVILFITVRWKPKLYFDLKSASSLLKFGRNIMCANLIGTIFNQLNTFVIGKKYTSSDLAYYDRGKTFSNLITENISNSLQSVLFPAMSFTGDQKTVKKIAQQSTRCMSYIIFPLQIGLMVTAEQVISVLLTDKWLETVPYLRITCVAGMISIIDSTNGLQVLKALGYSNINLKLEFVKKPLYIITLLIGIRFGVLGIALTVPINATIAMIINTSAASKKSGYTLAEQIKDCWPAFWMSTIMGILVYLLTYTINNNFILLCMQIIVAIIIYVLLSIVTRNKEFMLLLSIISNKVKKK